MRASSFLKLATLCCAIALGAWAIANNTIIGWPAKPQRTPIAALDAQQLQALETPKEPAMDTPSVPQPEGTWQPPLPGITPTIPEPTITPTPAILQTAVLITPSTITTMTQDLDVKLDIQRTIDTEEPLVDMAWVPTGDKLLYVTSSGKLYWSNLDGSNATLLHTYDTYGYYYSQLSEQRPLGNVLFVNHLGQEVGGKRLPSHIDIIRFAQGQPPTVQEDHDVPFWSIHWWSPDRASAIGGLHYLENAYYWGGDRLVTLDANGHVIEERNIPYMVSSAMRPGGEWLAYATAQQSRNIPMQGAYPETTYMLNMNTGQRLQVTAPGEGRGVGSWSPDGNWFMGGRGLISADGSEWIARPWDLMGWGIIGDTVWSPDSRYLAFSLQGGGCEPEGCTPYVSKLYIVDVQERKVAELGDKSFSPKLTGMVMRPRWSPDGSQLALMSYDEGCFTGDHCSGSEPALYFATLREP